MISEKQLSEYFHSFWKSHFPLLDTAYVRRFNAENKIRLFDIEGQVVLPVPIGEKVERFDLVSELAFELARETYQSSPYKEPDLEQARVRAEATIARLKGHPKISSVTRSELTEANALLDVYSEFFRTLPENSVLQFRPRIRGAGVLNLMEGDFADADTLFEVKAVNRNLQYTDLRQLLCYLFCGLGSKKYSWTRYCIFNPRLAVHYTGTISGLLEYLSGRPLNESIYNVLDALMEREQPLESLF
ncbi:hypothetical protein JIN85_16690 [Luteolibacter pohnpeiensis]|uniref:Uncharacterized protein n=1 Tax=Luteolibacter pohnpeiensis TaxID=454153 RepID=A0A934VY11_9BACT|nr:hypothetical protein [Luteolibacter pohnpeiensis]MBK1884059.1 hypothetical protein [Luteolibacter pohnpeiensis]